MFGRFNWLFDHVCRLDDCLCSSITTHLDFIVNISDVFLFFVSVQFGHLTLGQQAPAFSTIGKAFVALFRTVLGDFDYDAISQASPIIGPIFFFLCKSIFVTDDEEEEEKSDAFLLPEDIFSMVFLLFNMVLVGSFLRCRMDQSIGWEML